MKDAAGLSGQSQSMPDPINRAATYYSGAPAQRQEKGFSESENGQALKSVLGLGNMDVYAAKGLKVKKETK